MNWALFWNVILVIAIILVVALVVLYFVGNKLQKRQVEQQEMMEAMKQTVSMLVIDKKKMKIKDAGLPKQVYDQMPKYMRRMKMPIVKAKIGPKVVTMLCEGKIFDVLPVKTEVKAVISGLYITEVKSARGGLLTPPAKKKLFSRKKKEK